MDAATLERSSHLTNLSRDTLGQSVLSAVRAAILSRELQPGRRLQVGDLAQTLGVSRTPVKDALNRLAAEGLVRIVPRRGTFVATLSVEDVVQNYDVRKIIEVEASRRLVERRDSATLKRLRQAYSDLEKEQTAGGSSVEAHIAANFLFHETLFRAAGNACLLEIYHDLRTAITITRIHHQNAAWRERLGQEHSEHTAILQALTEWDPRAAADAISAHLDRASSSLVADMQVGGRTPST